jgi:hypothetical protein
MADEPKPLTGDPAVLNELFIRWGEWSRQHVNDADLIFKSAFEFNKQIAAMHERLLLVSLGTIGLSVTALTAFIPKIPSAGFPKHVFVWLIAPAWVLLMISSLSSATVIAHTVVANRVLLVELRKLVNNTTFSQAVVHLRKLSAALTGTITYNSQAFEASELFTKLADNLNRQIQEPSGGFTDGGTKETPLEPLRLAKLGRFARITLYLGLILLCISAIRLFLSF